MKRKIKKLKAYNYKTFEKARIRGYTKQQWQRSIKAKKTWDNLPELKKEIIIEKLKTYNTLKRNKKKETLITIKKDDKVYAYRISSQSHYIYRSKKYNTLMEYTTSGIFENEPKIKTIEKMIKNSLISAFNNGKTGRKGFLKNSVFYHLVDNNIRGLEIEKVLVSKNEIVNKLSAELTIKNNGNIWRGRN